MEKTAEFEGIDASDVYLRLESEEAIESKKEILESVAAVLRMQINSERFRKLDEELKRKRIEAKNNIDEIKPLVNEMLEMLPSMKSIEELNKPNIQEIKKPDVKKPEKKIKKKRVNIAEEKKPFSLKDELDEIHKRLESLG